MSFDYFYGQQSDLFTFYRVPKVLFTNERFWNISADAKMLYGILLDRMSLSAKNGWIDKNGRVYIIFTIDEAKMALNCAEQKAIKLLSELEKKAGLIERKRQGLGKPNLIYVKNFISAVDSQLLNCENHNSGTMEITTQELPKSQCNNTDIKNTEFSDTDSIFPSGNGGMMDENDRYQEYFDYFSDQLSMDLLKKDYPYDSEMLDNILELIVETVCTKRPLIRIGAEERPTEIVRSRFMKLNVKNVPVHAAQVINDKKVSDHHAIIPTKEAIKCSLDDLPKGEQAILRLIATRLFCAVGEPFRYNESVIELSDGNYIFSAKGKTTVQSGWKIFSGKPADKDKEGEKQLPSLTVGEGLSVYSTEVKEGKTSPPKHFTEDTLLQSMETAGADEMPEDAERKGLGTPATRAATIEKLVRIGFLERKGDKKTKHLISTHKGTALVTVMPEQIQSPSMTADWEEKLLMIERGEYDSNAFLKEIQDMISALVQTYEKVKGSDVLMAKEVQTVGVCPVCGSSVTERQKGFFCSKRECHFALWKNSRYFESIGKSLTSAVAQKLLSNGEVKLKGCKSAKTGRMYDATVVMTVTEEGKPQFNMNFENGGKSK